MKKIRPLIYVMAILLFGCGERAARNNITRVFEEVVKLERSHSQDFDGDTKMSEKASAFSDLAMDLSAINKKGCPQEFQIALDTYVATVAELSAAQRATPDHEGELLVQGLLNFMNGEADAGMSRIDGRLKQAWEELHAAKRQMLRIASSYGVEFKHSAQ